MLEGVDPPLLRLQLFLLTVELSAVLGVVACPGRTGQGGRATGGTRAHRHHA
jgi:hypothetical protein